MKKICKTISTVIPYSDSELGVVKSNLGGDHLYISQWATSNHPCFINTFSFNFPLTHKIRSTAKQLGLDGKVVRPCINGLQTR